MQFPSPVKKIPSPSKISSPPPVGIAPHLLTLFGKPWPQVKRCSGNFYGITWWNQKPPASCVLLKSCSENFWDLPGKSFRQSAYWKLITMLNMSSVTDVFYQFSENIQNSYFKRKSSDDVPYFIKKHLWMSASDETTL